METTDDFDKPKLKRLLVNDATYEKLQDIMSENSIGVLAIRDELAGLCASFERAGREGERQFWLTSWNGYSSYSVDRITRGTIYLSHACLSLFGAIQPIRLRQYLAALSENSTINDGMIQRLQVVVWPEMPQKYVYTDRPPNTVAQQQVQCIFDQILKLEPPDPIRCRFSPEAQDIFVTWIEQLETRLRDGGLDPALAAHLSKYRGLMPSLALIFEMAERASKGFVGFGGLKVSTVSPKNTVLAIRWCDYLESHARRVYAVFSPEILAAQNLAQKIKDRKLGKDGSFVCRDIYIENWHGLNSPPKAKAAVETLQKFGWVRPVVGKGGPSGGRPSDKYEVNPKIWKLRN
jgi:putative DNA primase/helicase